MPLRQSRRLLKKVPEIIAEKLQDRDPKGNRPVLFAQDEGRFGHITVMSGVPGRLWEQGRTHTRSLDLFIVSAKSFFLMRNALKLQIPPNPLLAKGEL